MPKTRDSETKAQADGRSAVKAARTQWRTRQILDAATTLMEDSGFHAMSIQSLADEAEVSVGLVYQYFGSKEDVLQAVIVDILTAYSERVPDAIAASGDDPVERLAAGFTAYCTVVDGRHRATALAYRESKTLTPAGLELVKELDKELELSTVQPILDVITDGQHSGVFLPVDAELMTHNLMAVAHNWALKHWHLATRYSLDEYIERQLTVALRYLLDAESWANYPTYLSDRPSKPAAKTPRRRSAS
jgi:AcrR family transcriptional regulator